MHQSSHPIISLSDVPLPRSLRIFNVNSLEMEAYRELSDQERALCSKRRKVQAQAAHLERISPKHRIQAEQAPGTASHQSSLSASSSSSSSSSIKQIDSPIVKKVRFAKNSGVILSVCLFILCVYVCVCLFCVRLPMLSECLINF